ncbi:MAG: Gldg family protein [Sumerlaeia bacterium]
MGRKLFSLTGLLLAVVLLVAVNIISRGLFRGARVDLTEEKLYTLSEGTREILRNLEEPIEVTFYFSEQMASGYPSLKSYGNYVQELLREYSDIAGDKMTLTVINPEPFSEEEDQASLAGLQAAPLQQGGDPFFFGAVLTNTIDEKEVIAFFDPRRENLLEYDLTRSVYELSDFEEKVVGLMTNLPVMGEQDMMARMQGRGSQPWVIYDMLSQLYDVREVSTGTRRIPDDVDVLIVIQPMNLSEATLYAIDQFVLRGGRLLAFVDSFADVYQPPPDPQNQFAAFTADKSSSLGVLEENWGVTLADGQVLLDREAALQVPVQTQRGIEQVNAPNLLRLLGEEYLNQDDVVTNNINQGLIYFQPGAFQIAEDAKAEVTTLVESSTESMLKPVSEIRFVQNPSELLKEFEPSGQTFPMAVRLTGQVPSAFPNGAPAADGEEAPADEEHIAEAQSPINVILVSDVDMIFDRYWVQVIPFFGQRIYQPQASNGDFALNAVENLFGSEALISVRGRGSFQRPFEVVNDLEEQAQERFRERQEELRAALEETEQRITELQAGREDANALVMTPEQRQEIEKLQEKRAETRVELREVRRQLRADIDELGTRLKLINLGAVPLLVALAALVVGGIRVSRRRRR